LTPQRQVFFKTVNGTLKLRVRHTAVSTNFPGAVSLRQIKSDCMKFRLLPALYLLVSNVALAQNTLPTTTFPFNITLLQPDSTTVNTTDLLKKDKPTVLAFWLTTCMPCQAEFAAYSKNFEAWQQEADFRLLAVSIDFPDRFPKIGQLAKEKKWPFPVYWDNERAFKAVLPGGLNGLPQVFLFDKNGQLVWQHKRYRPGDEAELFAKIKEAQ